MTLIRSALIALGAVCLPMTAIRPQCGADVHFGDNRTAGVQRAAGDIALVQIEADESHRSLPQWLP